MNLKKMNRSLFLLILVGLGMVILPNTFASSNNITSTDNNSNSNQNNVNPQQSGLSINDWANLSGQVAKFLENNAIKVAGYSWNESGVYYYNQKQGASGIGMLFVNLYKQTKNPEYLNVAEQIGTWFDKKASSIPSGEWPEFNSSIAGNYTGLEYGAAGVGDFLFQLYGLTSNATYYSLANDVVNYLSSIKINEGNGTKYPTKNATIINGEQKTVSSSSILEGSSSSSLSLLSAYDSQYYNINSQSDTLEQSNGYDSAHFASYSIGSSPTYTSNCVELSQQFYFDSYPITLTNGVNIMVYADAGMQGSVNLQVGIFIAEQDGYPNTTAQVGGYSSPVPYSELQVSAGSNAWTQFSWSSNTPTLNGSSPYGYCIVLGPVAGQDTGSNQFFHAALTTSSSYNRGILSSLQNSWLPSPSNYNLVFNITTASQNYATADFSLNLTDFGLPIGFNTNYISQITVTCSAKTSISTSGSGVYLYEPDYVGYHQFGSVSSSEQNFTTSITSDISNYLNSLSQTLTIRLSSADTSSYTLSIDLLNITLYYNDQSYSFDHDYGAAGIGDFYLDAYSVDPSNLQLLENAENVGNYLINNAIITKSGGLTCAAWNFGFGNYYTAVSDGVAGVGDFLLRLSKLNNTDNQYRDYAMYSANWLLSIGIKIPVYDHLDNYIGTGVYWKDSNSTLTSTVYNGYQTGVAGIADFLINVGLSESQEGQQNIYLNNATMAGNFLISSYNSFGITTSAEWSVYQYSWSEYAFSIGNPDLSSDSGTAGIMVFLDNLYLVTHDINFSLAVSGAYQYLLTQSLNGPVGKYWNLTATSYYNYGFGSGIAGIAASFLNIYFNSYDSVIAAQNALNWLYTQRNIVSSNQITFNYSLTSDVTYSGLSSGTAGVGLAFLDLYKSTGNYKYFTYASYCARSLQPSSSWTVSNKNSSIAYGMANGVAGIGIFFLNMAETSSQPLYSNVLTSIADYLIAHAIKSGNQTHWECTTNDTTSYFGYDYGNAGIMDFFTQLYQFYHNGTYLQYAEGVANWLNTYNSGNGQWRESVSGGNYYYGFSTGAAGIGYSLLDLYSVTLNSTYKTIVDQVYNSLNSLISSNSIQKSSVDQNKYTGIQDGQAGILKFLSSYYEYNPSTTVNTTLSNLVSGLVSHQESSGSFPYYFGSSTQYNSFAQGDAGIINGLISAYSVNLDERDISMMSNIKNYLIAQQNTDKSWSDNSDPSVYLGYGNGVAGISDQLLKVLDLSGPSLTLDSFNKTLSQMQYSDSLQINVSSSDVGSGVNKVILAYSINGSSWNESPFTYNSGSSYSAVISAQHYNSSVKFYFVSIDGTGLLNVNDNNGNFYSYVSNDFTAPQFLNITTYDLSGNVAPIQYATGGKIVAQLGEPSLASGIASVIISYMDTQLTQTPTTTTMTKVAGTGNTYEITIPGTNYQFNDTFLYNITTSDKAGNVNSTGVVTTKIGDDKLPHIDYQNTETQLSTSVPAYTAVKIKVAAYDDNQYSGSSGVAEVYVNYTTNGGSTWSQVKLPYSSSDGKYEGQIPGQGMGRVYYMLVVKDRAGNTAYYDSSGNQFSNPTQIVTPLLFTYAVTINWVITISIIAAIAVVILIVFYLQARRGDYWDRMRRQAGTTASMITVQEKLTNVYYSIMGYFMAIGNWFNKKFTRPPGMPSPLRVWYEDHLGDTGKKILSGIGHSIKSFFKGIGLTIISPFYLVAWLVRKTGGMQAFVSVIISLLMIIFTVIKYISSPPYPLVALFFINFGFILFISSFLLLIFHLIYKISYK